MARYEGGNPGHSARRRRLMKRRDFCPKLAGSRGYLDVKAVFPLLLAVFAALSGLAHAAEAKPNILFILADDLGIDGVSCYGADVHKTPQVDQLAATGTRFKTCYAAPLCGPSGVC